MRITYSRELDSFGPQANRAYSALAALIAVLLVVLWRRDPAGLVTPFDTGVKGQAFLIVLGAWTLGLAFELVRRRRWGCLAFHRKLEGNGDLHDRIAARLLELGYRLEPPKEKEDALRFLSPPRSWLKALFSSEIPRYLHEVVVQRGEIRFRFREPIMVETGESEYAERLLEFLSSESEELQLRRTLFLFAPLSIWLVGVAVVAAHLQLRVAPCLAQVAPLFALVALVIGHLQRRRAYGRRFALMAAVLGGLNYLLFYPPSHWW